MKGLYKGKYIIAVYDKNGILIEVACSPKELRYYANYKVCRSTLSRISRGLVTNNRVHLIDVTEKHDDIFSEEDEAFIDFMKNSNKNKVSTGK